MSDNTMFINEKLTVQDTPPFDPLQSFVRNNHIALKSTGEGILSDYVFAAKDVFRIKGSTWGNGHPEFLEYSDEDQFTSSAIVRLLDNGSDLVGKTICDELCYSISGENWHYGSPINPHDVRRLAGGSSSGSCTVTAGGLVDFAIGSDCLGSVRVPASYNGLLGIRPTYERIPTDGEVEYCETMDVLGFVARDIKTFKDVGEVLLQDDKKQFKFKKLLIAEDCFNAVDGEVSDALKASAEKLKPHFEEVVYENIANEDLEAWTEVFRIVQGYEVWHSYKDFIETKQPFLTPGPKDRLETASQISDELYEENYKKLKEIEKYITEKLGDDTIVVMPTASSVAPLKSAAFDEINRYRQQSSKLLCVSPLSGIPQITIPDANMDDVPLGISILGPHGSDRAMIDLIEEVFY